MKKYILFILLVFLFLSCKDRKLENSNKDATIGNVFSFPDTIEFIKNGSFYLESRKEFMHQYKDSPIILNIIWGDCHVCVNKLFQWSGIISKDFFGENTKYIIIISTSDKDYFLRNYYEPLVNIPVLIIDTNKVFFKINNLENNPGYNTFLLDQDYKILIQGNPLIIDNFIESYQEKIKVLE